MNGTLMRDLIKENFSAGECPVALDDDNDRTDIIDSLHKRFFDQIDSLDANADLGLGLLDDVPLPDDVLEEVPSPVDNDPGTKALFDKKSATFELLSREEMISLFKAAHSGDTGARERLILSNIRLVFKLADRYSHSRLDRDDLVQEGLIGLMKAIDKFDYTLGYCFSTYATFWIQQKIGRACMKMCCDLTVPYHSSEKRVQLNRVANRLSIELSRDPTTTELSEAVGIPAEKVSRLLQIREYSLPIDMPVGEGAGTYCDIIPDNAQVDPFEEVSSGEMISIIQEILDGLPPKEREMIRYRYGFCDGEFHTLSEVSKMSGLSVERCRQLILKGLDRMRKRRNADRLKDFLYM